MAASPRFTEAAAARLIAQAETAARAAYHAATPTPMIVGTPKDPVASLLGGDDGGLDPGQPIYHVAGGVCGFAWVNIRPANSSFARRARKLIGGHKGYYGGWEIRPEVGRGDQSYERKLAACTAYADVLREAGITAYADGRLD